MKNRKGFTLIELLAVIVLLGLIAAVSIPSILKFSKNSKENLYCGKIEIVEKAAEQYGSTINLNSYCEIDNELYNCETVTVNTLLNNNYLIADEGETTILDPRSKSSMNTTEIIIFEKNNRTYALANIGECNIGDREILNTQATLVNTYILNINPNGGKYDNKNFVSLRLREGDTYTLLEPSKENNAFVEWTFNSDSSTLNHNVFTMGTEDTTITADWEQTVFSIIIDSNGGTYNGETTFQVERGTPINLETPTATGYLFTGWVVEGAGSVLGNSFVSGAGDAVIVAQWTPSE